jgi:hypothetical protein
MDISMLASMDCQAFNTRHASPSDCPAFPFPRWGEELESVALYEKISPVSPSKGREA